MQEKKLYFADTQKSTGEPFYRKCKKAKKFCWE
jgi:hypothetical protein